MVTCMDIATTLTMFIFCELQWSGFNNYFSLAHLLGSTECQDGVTNNCTQECTRDMDAGVYNCSCFTGYELSNDSTTCKGKWSTVGTKHNNVTVLI